MSKPRLKFLIFLAGLAVLIPASFIGFSLLSQFISEFNRGAEPASIFHGHSLTVPTADQAQWLPDPNAYEGLKPGQAEREEIISAYWEAWEALRRTCLTADESALPTYWAGWAYEQVQAVAHCPKGVRLEHEGHRLQLQFFSDDSSVISMTDDAFRLRYVSAEATDDLQAKAAIIMTNDLGVWRIRQMQVSLYW